MRRILPVKCVRLKHNADADEIVICTDRIDKHCVQGNTAARPRRLLLHIGVDALAHVLARLLDGLIATDNRIRTPLEFIVLRPCAYFKELVIGTIADEGREDRHHDDHADERDHIQLKADTPSPFLPLFLQNILSFPLRPTAPDGRRHPFPAESCA